jgi:hypothetical protein
VNICWAPECANPLGETKPKGQPRRYCSGACRIRAIRRNGGKAPSEPYPPLAPADPLHQDAPGVTVAEQFPPGAAALPRVAAPTSEQGPADHLSAGPTQDSAAGRPDGLADGPGESFGGSPGYPESSAEDLDPRSPTVPVLKHPLVEAYRADLTALGKQDSVDGLKILEMAGKLVSASSSPAASANLSKELDRLLADLKAAAQPKGESDPFNVIRERTLRKLVVVGVRERLPA